VSVNNQTNKKIKIQWSKEKDKKMIYKNTTQKTKDRATRKHHKRNGCTHRCSGRVRSSCSTTGIIV
jgi:hypothetical protein